MKLQNLPSMDINGLCDPYLQLYLYKASSQDVEQVRLTNYAMNIYTYDNVESLRNLKLFYLVL